MTDFAELTSLPGTDRERSWLERRLTFLSEKEKYIVSAIIIGRQPASMAEAINQLLTIGDYEVCFPAGSYRELGEFYLRHEAKLPDNALWTLSSLDGCTRTSIPDCSSEIASWFIPLRRQRSITRIKTILSPKTTIGVSW